jgi:hypothetical protein
LVGTYNQQYGALLFPSILGRRGHSGRRSWQPHPRLVERFQNNVATQAGADL